MRPCTWASTRVCSLVGSRPRAFATMFTCASAAASLMSGSKPVKSDVTRSIGTGAETPAASYAATAFLVFSASSGLDGPRLLPAEFAALHGCRASVLALYVYESRPWKYLGLIVIFRLPSFANASPGQL